MAAIDNLNTNVQALQAAAALVIAALQSGSSQDPAIQSAADAVAQVTSELTAALPAQPAPAKS